MRINRFLIILLICATVAEGPAQPPKAEQEPVDKTGKVYSGLANMIVVRDDVAPRFAFVAIGEKHYIGKETLDGPGNIPIVRPFYAIRIVDRKTAFDYTAYGSLNWNLQVWKEKLRCQGKLKIAKGYVNRDNRYIERPPGLSERRFLELNNFDVFHFDPFDDLISAGNQFESLKTNKNKIEDIFLKRSDFLASTEITHGDVKSHWKQQLRSEAKEFDITLVQSAVHDFLPVEIQFICEHGHMKDFFTHTRCDWKKHGKFLLPHRVETASVRYYKGKPITYQWHMKFLWLVGEDVPEDFFNCDSLDYREPIRAHFDLNFDQYFNGLLIRAEPWVTPEDLFMDSPIQIKD